MNIQQLKLRLLPFQGYRAPIEIEGDDLEGDVISSDEDASDDAEDRGDSFGVDEKSPEKAEPEAKEEPKDEAKSEAKDEPAEDKQPKLIPKSRFDEVIAERNAERERVADLERRFQALEAASKSAPKEPAAEVKGVEELETEYANLMMEGDIEKAVKLRSQINAAIRQQAEDAAEQRLTQREQARAQKAMETELNAMAAQITTDYPYLDTEAGEMVVPQITALRDAYMAKGMGAAEALRKAADYIAPRFDPSPAEPAEKPMVKHEDKRTASAIQRGIKDSAAQPPQMTGVGNRAMETVKRDVNRMSEDEFDSLPESEKRAMRGD